MTDEQHKPDTGTDGFARISPAYVRLDEPEAQPGYREPESPWSTGIVLWALFGLVCLLGAVFLWLPGEVAEREQQATPAAVPPAAQPATAPKPKPGAAPQDPAASGDAAPDVDATLDAREKVEKLRSEVVTLRDALKERGANQWASQEWQGLGHLIDKGERELQARNFDLAEIAFTEAQQSAKSIEASAEKVFDKAMTAGKAQLEAENPPEAVKSFDLALSVRPDDKDALSALDRAIKRSDVLEHMREGRNLETAENLPAARDAYAKAVELDPDYQPAADALERVQQLINDRAFRSRLSKGLALMEQGDFEAARESLEGAQRLRPDSDEVADALSQVQATLKARATDAEGKRAADAEEAERWRDAEASYDSVLAQDPSLAFAQTGRKRAAERAALDEQLAAMLDNRKRLNDAAVQQQAEALLTRARQIDPAGPRLSGQIASLEQTLRDAQTPVEVVLQSDGSTRVTVHHLGELGQFDRKTLDMPPGDYVAVGRRSGYRDVRVEFSVEPGMQAAGPVQVVCQESI